MSIWPRNKPLPREPGERYRARNGLTGATIVVVDANEAYLDAEPGRWVSLCDTHSNLVNHETLRLAKGWATEPWQWCDDCYQIVKEKGLYDA